MKGTKEICARERVWDTVILTILILFLGLGLWLYRTEATAEALTLIICALSAAAFWGYRLSEQQYLDEEGITVRRFGRAVRFLAWRDVGQVHRIYREKFTVLMVTPSACPAFRPGGTCDGHLSECKGQAILLDDSKQNRAYIEQVWGKILVLDRRGYPVEGPKR